jgi:hypothetical protein
MTLPFSPGGFSTAFVPTIADTLENEVRPVRRFFGSFSANAMRLCLKLQMTQFA